MNINFNTIINFLQEVNQRFAITSIFEEREVGHILNQQELIIVLIILVVGLLWCFAGHLMVRLWAALLGFGLGFALGAMIGSLFTADGLILAICGGVLGLIFGIFSARILPLGTFLVVLLSVFALTALILGANNFMMLGISLAVALVLAILSFKLPAPIVIIVTSICGSLVSAETLGILVNYNLLIYVVVAVALAVGGMCTQFLFENGKRKRQHLERANEIKDSKAEDIEKARNLADVLDEEPKVDIQTDEDIGKENKKEKSKKEKPEKEKPKKGKKDQIQIIFDNIEDDEEFNYGNMNKDNLTFDGELEDKKSKEEEQEKDGSRLDESKEKQEMLSEKKVDKEDLKKSKEEALKSLSQEKTELVADGVIGTKDKLATDIADVQGEILEEPEELEGKSKLAKEPEIEEEGEEQEINVKSTLEKPKKEKPEDNYIVKNIQVEEEIERKATELERAKRDWINQLVSDKSKDED